MKEQQADIALGSRLGKDSQMPLIRTIGNTIFAWILGLLSKQTVGDTASGMRVIRRTRLDDLNPLPTGLHYTPAMSARVLLEQKHKLVELPMSYSERVGRSKLSVIKDGWRFLTVIVRAAMCFRPSRPLLLIAAIAGLLAGLVAIGPTWHWFANGSLEESMIYRILLASLLATVVALLVCAAVLVERVAAVFHGRTLATGVTGVLVRVFRPVPRRILSAALVIGATVLVWPGISQFVRTTFSDGPTTVDMHWSRAVLASLLLVFATMVGITAFVDSMMDLIEANRGSGESQRPPERLRRAQPPKHGSELGIHSAS